MDCDDLVIPLNGLASGKHLFRKKLGKEFFAGFDEDAVLDASVDVEIEVTKSGGSVSVVCRADGEVAVPCDRCLDRVAFPLEFERKFSVSFSGEGSEDDEDSEDAVVLPGHDSDLDMKQYVYDYCMLGLPLRRVHRDGECDMEMIRILEECRERKAEETSPFVVLKGIVRGDDDEI